MQLEKQDVRKDLPLILHGTDGRMKNQVKKMREEVVN